MRLALPLTSLLLAVAPCVSQTSATVPGIPVMERGDVEDDLESRESGQEPWMAPTPASEPETDAAGPVPEPSTFLLVSTGFLGIALTARRRRKQAATA